MMKDRMRALLSRWPFMLIGSLLLLVFIAAATIRESYRGWQVDQEIKALESQAEELEGRNQRLLEIAQALQSPERLEVEARKRLGLRQPGERVTVLNGFVASGTNEGVFAMDVVEERPVVTQSNPEQWLNYFFYPERLPPL